MKTLPPADVLSDLRRRLADARSLLEIAHGLLVGDDRVYPPESDWEHRVANFLNNEDQRDAVRITKGERR